MGFLKGADLVWIIGILSSIVAGLNAWKKYRYEEKLKLFRETNTNLFKEEKEVVLAAISTLSIFKRDPNFENQTTNVLLSRLYTDLDYDITNAICSALIQYSNREELLDISSEILDINRNFFVQDYPVKGMTSDLDKNWLELKRAATKRNSHNGTKSNKNSNTQSTASTTQEKEPDKNNVTEIEKAISADLLKLYEKRSIVWIPKNRYEFLWHRQITANTYSRILRRASYLNTDGKSNSWKRYFRIGKTKRKMRQYTELDMRFYQNDFNYVFMADFKTNSCSISRSAISMATLVDVGFNNVDFISQTFFDNSTIDTCSFNGASYADPDLKGRIEDKTSFKSCNIVRTKFKSILFRDVDFNEAFIERSGFEKSQFEDCYCLGTRMDSVQFNQNRFTNCQFKNMVIANSFLSGCVFAQCEFENVAFENINFSETYFAGSSLVDVQFINCKGLSSHHFYKYKTIAGNSFLPSYVDKTTIDALKGEEIRNLLAHSSLYEKDKEYLEQIIGLPKETSQTVTN